MLVIDMVKGHTRSPLKVVMDKKSSKVKLILEKLGLTVFSKQLSTNKEHKPESVAENENKPTVQALTSVELDYKPEPKQMSTFFVEDNDSEILSTHQGSDLENAAVQEKKKKIQPEGTIAYKILVSDTLEKIAAHFDTTPSELKKLNKLISSMIFPGQTLFIPVPRKSTITSLTSNDGTLEPSHSVDKNGSPEDKSKCPDLDATTENSSPNRVPGHTEKQGQVSSSKEMHDFDLFPPHKLTEDEVLKLDNDCMKKFVKIKVRHITDGQGVVKGTLLVTPNAIMFDPDVLDPLVIEHGTETYGMIAPMDMIISAAMYHDIAAMKMRGQILEDGTEYQMPEVYHDLSCPMAMQRLHNSHKQQDQFSSILPQHVQNILSNPLNRQDSVCSCGALERSNSLADADNYSRAEAKDNVNKDDDYRIVDVSEYFDKGGNEDPVLYKDLCAIELASTICEEGNKVKSYGEDFGLDKNNANEVSTSKTDAKSNIGELDEGSLKTEALVNVSDADSKKVKSNIKLGSVRKQLSVSFSFPEHEEVQSISSDTLNDIVANANKNNIIKDTAKDDGAKSDDIYNNRMKNYSKICQTSDDGNDTLVGMTENSVIGVSIGTDRLAEKDTNDQTHVKYVEKTETTPSKLYLDESVEISKPELENADSTEVSKTENRSVEKVRSSSTSSLGPFSPTAHLNAFVTYATGFFQRHASDNNIRDNKDVITDSLTDSIPEKPQLEKISDIPLIAAAPGKRHSKLIPHGDVKTVAVESAITMADKPDLLTMDYNKFAPKPAVMFKDPPLYLCLRLGRRSSEKYSYHNYSIASYGKKCKRSEYWFSIPREKVDSLYAFLVQWTPEIYGDDEEITPEKRGFVVIEDGYNEDLEEQFGTNANFHKDWEIISLSEALKRRSIVFEVPLSLPDMIGESTIMTEKHVASLSPVMIGRIVGYPWTLIYSTDKNGFSLNTLYRVMARIDSPVLIVVLDDCSNVFGALTSFPPKISDSFYGTGESFLFTFYPEFKVFTWSGENNFFMKGNKESLSIGAGQGVFGLWFDEDLYHGRTNKCETFNNDLLTNSEDFIVKGFEAWAFFWD